MPRSSWVSRIASTAVATSSVPSETFSLSIRSSIRLWRALATGTRVKRSSPARGSLPRMMVSLSALRSSFSRLMSRLTSWRAVSKAERLPWPARIECESSSRTMRSVEPSAPNSPASASDRRVKGRATASTSKSTMRVRIRRRIRLSSRTRRRLRTAAFRRKSMAAHSRVLNRRRFSRWMMIGNAARKSPDRMAGWTTEMPSITAAS